MVNVVAVVCSAIAILAVLFSLSSPYYISINENGGPEWSSATCAQYKSQGACPVKHCSWKDARPGKCVGAGGIPIASCGQYNDAGSCIADSLGFCVWDDGTAAKCVSACNTKSLDACETGITNCGVGLLDSTCSYFGDYSIDADIGLFYACSGGTCQSPNYPCGGHVSAAKTLTILALGGLIVGLVAACLHGKHPSMLWVGAGLTIFAFACAASVVGVTAPFVAGSTSCRVPYGKASGGMYLMAVAAAFAVVAVAFLIKDAKSAAKLAAKPAA